MSSRRTRGRNEDDINDLLLKLHALVSQSTSTTTTRVLASKIMKEICNYIKKLQKDADDLSHRLSQQMASMDINGIDADILQSLLQQ